MYSPKIEPKQVQELYLLKQALSEEGTKKPMTALVKEAIAEYLKKEKS